MAQQVILIISTLAAFVTSASWGYPAATDPSFQLGLISSRIGMSPSASTTGGIPTNKETEIQCSLMTAELKSFIKQEVLNMKTSLANKLDLAKSELKNAIDKNDGESSWDPFLADYRIFTKTPPTPERFVARNAPEVNIVLSTATEGNRDIQPTNLDLIKQGHTLKKSCVYLKEREIEAGHICLVRQGRVEFLNGNFVIRNANGRAVWSVTTNDPGHRLFFHKDGNLVLYNKNGKAKWASHTHLKGHKMVLHEDRDLIIYDNESKPLWSSITAE